MEFNGKIKKILILLFILLAAFIITNCQTTQVEIVEEEEE